MEQISLYDLGFIAEKPSKDPAHKDWVGNMNSIYVTNGASNHSKTERQEQDYYATSPDAVKSLLSVETFKNTIWECACGGGHIATVLENNGYSVITTDIIDRGYPGTEIKDFFTVKNNAFDIITNPPYKFAKEFVEHALDISESGVKIAMFLKLTFLEGKTRKALFKKYPPRILYVFSARQICAKDGDFESISSSAVAYAWYIWEKGFEGLPVIKRI